MNFGFWILDFGLKKEGRPTVTRKPWVSLLFNPKSKIQNPKFISLRAIARRG
jgi:hypothetical protein